MAQIRPLVINSSGDHQRIQSGDYLGVEHGGTGSTTATGARSTLGLQIGANVQAYNVYLAAIASLGTEGFVSRKSDNTAYARSITGSSGRVSVSNGDGLLGNPTIDLSTVSQGSGGSFVKITVDSYGRISHNTPVLASDITTLVDSTYVNVSGDTLTGYLTLHADPSNAYHPATKNYVDSLLLGITQWKDPVRGATTAALAITARTSTTLTIGGTSFVHDGVTYANNDRILVKNGTTGTGAGDWDNGIYYVSGVGSSIVLTRVSDANTSTTLKAGMTVWVNEGTTNSDTAWTITTDGAITIGTTAITISQTGGVTSIIAGAALVKNGNVIDLNYNASDFTVSSDVLTLKDIITASVSPSALKVAYDAKGRITSTSALTAGDIGAQVASAELAALAGLGSTGILVRTGAGAYTTRSITATNGRITVSNGSGVGGNVDLDLPSITSAGTYYSVNVDVYGRVTGGSTTPTSGNSRDSLTNGEVTTAGKFKAVYSFTTSGQFKLARADASGTMRAIGLTAAAINASVSGEIITSGTVSGTTGEWDAVTGQTGGLTPGSVYYLSNTTYGNLTTAVPSSGYLVRVGVATSNQKLLIQLGEPVQL